jgi:hypothetical protein
MAPMGRFATLCLKPARATGVALTFALAATAPTAAQDRLPATAMEKAGWTLITASEDVFVYMRAAEKAQGGLRRAWTAYDAGSPRNRDGFVFRSVKSLGDFDCRKNISRVVYDTYHDSPALSGKSWHSPKFIPTPWAMPEPGSVGALRMAFVCKALNET